MYVLIRIGTNDSRSSEFVSKTKNKLVNKIKEDGYYWSKKTIGTLTIKTVVLMVVVALITLLMK